MKVPKFECHLVLPLKFLFEQRQALDLGVFIVGFLLRQCGFGCRRLGVASGLRLLHHLRFEGLRVTWRASGRFQKSHSSFKVPEEE
eukprot:1045800-Amphidinium_carterae.1